MFYAALLLAPCAGAWAQEAERSGITSRAGEIEAEREQKARELGQQKPSQSGSLASKAKNSQIFDRLTGTASGLRLRLGGLATGSGIAAGPAYYRELAHQEVVYHASAAASVRKFFAIETGVDFPRLADKRAFAALAGGYENYPHIDYYGEGANSKESGRTSYAFEDTSFLGKAGVRPVPHLSIGGFGRYWLVNVGRSMDRRLASTEQVYSEAQAPGITRQTNYLIGGAFVQYDNRDDAANPRGGGDYVAEYAWWSDRKLGTGSFDRLDLEAQHYFSFFNQRRIIALRGHTAFTEPGVGQTIPFYAQPSLGGPDDLRGFRPYRFHDRNSLVMNAEYRWEVSSGLEMALFVDAGRVYHRWQDVSLDGLEKSYGFGVRLNIKNRSFMRVDTGFSREGVQVWLKFGKVF